MKTKKCTQCGSRLSLSCFYRSSRSKDGHQSMCKKCYQSKYGAKARIRTKQWNADNPERKQEMNHQYFLDNTETILTRSRTWHWDNRDKVLIKSKERYAALTDEERTRHFFFINEWRRLHPDLYAHHTQKRRAQELLAVPPWYEEDGVLTVYTKCKELNEMWGTNFQVDHIVPLQGKNVCGLHCLANLQLLDKELNNKKRNTWDVDEQW